MAETFGSEPPWRVLLVEDEYFLADDLRRDLERAGAAIVGPVATVGRALALLAETPAPSAAVLDVNLQDEMVWPVADALQARGIPFVFATGYGDAILPARFRDAPFFHKPFDAGGLVESLQHQRRTAQAAG